MRSPEGQEFSNAGCYLEIVPNEKLVWTSALSPGYRPAFRAARRGWFDELYFTAIITLEAQGAGTKYTAVAIHADEATTKKTREDTRDGGTALDQLVALAKTS